MATTMSRRTTVLCRIRSCSGSGHSTSADGSITLLSSNSSRTGGSASGRPAVCSITGMSVSFRVPRTRREKHVVDASAEAPEIRAPQVGEGELMCVDLGADLSWMRRQHQDTGSHNHRLLDGVRDEQDGGV